MSKTLPVTAVPLSLIMSPEQYQELKAKNEAHNAWVDTLRKKTRCKGCRGTGTRWNREACPKCDGKGYRLGWASYRPEDRPVDVPEVTNEDRSKLEVYEFIVEKPQRYFAYVDLERKRVTTFTGALLGSISWVGVAYTVQSFGGAVSTRQNLRISAVNGLTYSAVYYKSSGDYCRMKAFKNTEVKSV